MQLLLSATVPPVNVTTWPEIEGGVPPQVVASVLGVGVRPVGMVSVNPTPASASTFCEGLVMV